MHDVNRISGRLPELQWAVASQPFQGENVSGDMHVVCPFQNGILVGVVDALGHGPEAAFAAKAAVAAIQRYASLPLNSLFQRCHEGLTRTRGVTAALAAISLQDSMLSWVAIGNVEGFVLRAEGTRPPVSIMQHGGVVGYNFPRLARLEPIPLSRGDRLVFATDGIHEGFVDTLTFHDPLPDLVEGIFRRFVKGSDDALVMAAEYVGRGP